MKKKLNKIFVCFFVDLLKTKDRKKRNKESERSEIKFGEKREIESLFFEAFP